MSKVYYCSDLHIGHNNISKYRHWVESCEHNTEVILEEWSKVVTKQDKVILLGDIIFDSKFNEAFSKLKGRKELILGNHCYQHSKDLHKAWEVFDEVHGFKKRGKSWLSHCPIHPKEMRNRSNIHGHIHTFEDIIQDPRYFNVNVDIIYPITGSIFIEEKVVKDMIHREESLIEYEDLSLYHSRWKITQTEEK